MFPFLKGNQYLYVYPSMSKCCQFIQKLKIPQRPNTAFEFSLGGHQFLTSVLRVVDRSVALEDWERALGPR